MSSLIAERRAVARWAAALVFLGLLSVMPTRVSAQQSGFRHDKLTLETATGRYELAIEVAESAQQKALGLMYRTKLPDNYGMLFPYGQPQEITMWMRNTYIPLDMVFITAAGTVHRIEVKAEPLNERVIASKGAVVAVLELPGGAAERYGLKAGDKVVYSGFGTAKP